jgi:hypothetical protein
MHKALLSWCAAALIALTGTAGAKPKTVDISLDGYCNIYHVTLELGVAHVQDTPSCSGNYGGGFVGAAKPYGKTINLAIQDQSIPGVQLMLVLSYPLISGGAFHLYQTTDGTSFQDMLDGTYSLVSAARMNPKGAMSVTSALGR